MYGSKEMFEGKGMNDNNVLLHYFREKGIVE